MRVILIEVSHLCPTDMYLFSLFFSISEDEASPVSQEGGRGAGSVENSQQQGNRRTG